jgi:IS4 transposase
MPRNARTVAADVSYHVTQRGTNRLTYLLHCGPTTIAAIYKDRWEIELFFKAPKQT